MQDDARASFRKLHESGCFVIPNPWDIGTARYLQMAGFKALASTSGGYAFSHGLPDEAIQRESVLKHLRELVEATGLPVNADFQSGYGETPDGVFESVRLCIGTGVAGLSIEDATGDPAHPLFDLTEALERLAAAREAIDDSGEGVLLTARAECFLVGHPDPLKESVRRLRAYREAGADVLYAPGPMVPDNTRAIVEAAEGKPVNAIVSGNCGLSVSDIAALGVRRISIGSALSRVAWTGLIRAAKALAEKGSFEGLEGAMPYAEINALFQRMQSPA